MKLKELIINTFMISAVLISSSCQKQDHAYIDFVKDGERIYLGKVIDVEVKPGNGRVGLSWGVYDSRAKKAKIKYNDGLDSVMLDVNKTSSVTYMDVVIDNLEERLYSFQIFLIDSYGNQSVAYKADGQSYGDSYQKSLNNRFISNVNIVNKNITLTWLTAKAPIVETKIEYYDANSNELQVVTIPVTSNTITLSNVKLEADIRYRTAYLPTSNALDMFYSEYSTYKINNFR